MHTLDTEANDPFPCPYKADKISSSNSPPPALSVTPTRENTPGEDPDSGNSSPAPSPAAAPAAVDTNSGSSPYCTQLTTASGFTFTYTPPTQESSSAAPAHRAQVQAARAVLANQSSITSVFEQFLETNKKLIAQHRTQTQELRQLLEQQDAEISLLHDEREALFKCAPIRKRKREGEEESQQGDSGLPTNYFGERPDLSSFLRLPQHQYIQEPQRQRRWRITDQYGPVDYDSGCYVNIENILHRFVLPNGALYPLELTNLVPTLHKNYFVNTPGGSVCVYGYGLAQAVMPFPNDRWGRVTYWVYYTPQAEASYQTQYGLLGSSIRHIDQYGRPQQQFTGSASGPSSA